MTTLRLHITSKRRNTTGYTVTYLLPDGELRGIRGCCPLATGCTKRTRGCCNVLPCIAPYDYAMTTRSAVRP
jgi:hypothetical protein